MTVGRGRSTPPPGFVSETRGSVAGRGRGRGAPADKPIIIFAPQEPKEQGEDDSGSISSSSSVRVKDTSSRWLTFEQLRNAEGDSDLDSLLESTDTESECDKMEYKPRMTRDEFDDMDSLIVSQYDINESRLAVDSIKYKLIKANVLSFDFEKEIVRISDQNDIEFPINFDDIINSSVSEIKLVVGSSIHMYKPPKSNESSRIVVGDLNILNGCRNFYNMTIPAKCIAGRLLIKRDPLLDDEYILNIFKDDLSTSSKSVEIPSWLFDTLHCFLPPKSGDDLLFYRDIEKIEIGRYKMFRDSLEISTYLMALTETHIQKKEVISRVIDCAPMWHFFANFDAKNPHEHFLEVLSALHKLGKVKNAAPTKCLQLLLEGDIMKDVSLQPFLRGKDTEIIESFFDMVFRFLPGHVKYLFKMFDNEAVSKSSVSMGKGEKILLNFNKNLLRLICNKDAETVNSILTPVELKKGMLFTNSETPLKMVKTEGPYHNAEEYISTYSRLLRTECFHGLQSGIQDFVNGELDTRDIHLYCKLTLKGYKINHFRSELAISFDTPTQVSNWRKSNMLMHGNVLAISCNCCFDDIIWAAVGTRDHDLLEKKQIIFIQLLDANKRNVGDIIRQLLSFNGQAAMIESPNYYQSFKPALKYFSSLDMDNLSLKNALLYAAADTFEDPDVSKKRTIEHAKNVLNTLEKSQRKAFLYAINHKIAVIQGPPGTGKTYIGAKIVEYLLSLNLTSPILVVTYKNHALDEFLKHVLKFVKGDKLLRIGSKCRDEAILECTLNGGNHTYKPIYLRYIRDKIEKLEQDIRDKFKDLNKYSRFTFGLFVSLNDVQSFLRFVTAYIDNFRSDDSVCATILETCQTQTFTEDQFKHISEVCWDNNEIISSDYDPDGTLQKLVNIAFDAYIEWLPNQYQLQDSKNLAYPNIGNAVSTHYLEPKIFSRDDYESESRERKKNDFDDSRGVHEKDLLFLSKRDAQCEDSIEVSDFPPTFSIKQSLLDIKNVKLWKMDNNEKYQLIFTQLKHRLDTLTNQLDKQFIAIENLQNEFHDKADKHKAQYLKTLKVIGATITGAGLQNELLNMVAPEVVIVEEAAEILEPLLLACLNPGIKRLIMIGDHEQLKPSVDVYELRRNYQFDTSLLERLVKLGYPYKTLQRQARMRSEFSAMLLDIYPKLCNLDGIDDDREPFLGIKYNRFWWDHQYEEKSDRSPCNTKEANMVMSLALYLVMCGIEPSSLTILAAYSGQLRLMLDLRHQLNQRYTVNLKPIEIRTIDEYQGDENDFVIVSLVRSNQRNAIGFLSERQRRCVSQSRARRGLYFVGNSDMFKLSKVWEPVVNKFRDDDCLGEELPLQCYKHQREGILVHQERDVTNIHFDPTDLMYYVRGPENLCSEPCFEDMPCGIKEHKCMRKCLPAHSHDICRVEVDKRFVRCGHTNSVHCADRDTAICSRPCPMVMSCTRNHACDKVCGHLRYNEEMDKNSHLAAFCTVGVEVYLETCHHIATFECNMLTAQVVRRHKCTTEVDYVCEHGHKSRVTCYQSDTFRCKEKIYNFTFPSCNHKSTSEKLCYQSFDKFKCTQLVSYTLPGCGHEAPDRKRCSDAVKNVPCKYQISFTSKCGHKLVRSCHQNDEDILCEIPCERILKCGHVCGDVCHKPCNIIPCKECDVNFQKYKTSILDQIEKARLEPPRADLKPLSRNSIGFISVSSKLNMMARPHGIKVKVETCKEIIFTDQLIRFQENQLETRGFQSVSNVEKAMLMFKDWNPDECDFYTTMQNKMLSENKLVLPRGYSHLDLNLNAGICDGYYVFLKDFSHLSEKLVKFTVILFDVFLGNVCNLTEESETALESDDIDSLYTILPPNVPIFALKRDEQMLPTHVLTIELCDPSLRPSSLTEDEFTTIDCMPTQRVLKSANALYRPFIHEAESLFYKHFSKQELRERYLLDNANYEPSCITIVVNRELEDAYFEKKREFKENAIPTNEIYAFHGTDKGNVDSIIRNNLNPEIEAVHGNRYGRGSYFSEFPFFSMIYGKALLVFKILPGNEFTNDAEGTVDFGSFTCRKISRSETSEYGEQLIIRNNHQFMPVYIIHFKKTSNI